MLQINKKLVRALSTFGLAAIIGLVAGCGGGGGGGGSSSTSSSGNATPSSGTTTGSPTPTTAGGTGKTIVAAGAVSNTPGTLANNQVAVVVSSATSARNMPMVSVTICQHSTANCATINNVQLDTGSYGLRLASSAVTAANGAILGTLTNVTNASSQAVAECMGFADGSSWGSVRTADVKIGGETASNLPIHILGDVPQSAAGGSNNACATGTLHDSPSWLGANGILGIGTAKYDCGTGCANTTVNGIYYGCTGSGNSLSNCTDSAVPVASQVANPVQFFITSGDKNGVILNMPVVGSSGTTSASGYLTFGLNTQANNVVPSSGLQTFETDHFGDVSSATLGGSTYTDTSSRERAAFFDTGSNGLFFPAGNTGLLPCSDGSGFYCPSSAVSLQPSVTGFNGTTASIAISIQNWIDMESGGGYALPTLGGDGGMLAVDFGMPFFYGRTVYLTYDTADSGTLNVGTMASVAF